MKIRLNSLHVKCKKTEEIVTFSDVSYFHGPMGTGKSTIARLIDYCFGSKQLEMTPALQNEFISAKLFLAVGDNDLVIERVKGSSSVTANWNETTLQIPVRNSNEILLPRTQVAILSDLFFYLIEKTPLIIRRSQLKTDSSTKRLTLRDLLMYCYLDQENLDSNFFNLDKTADPWKRLSSRAVLSTVIGTHQEKVAELEAKIEKLRNRRNVCRETAEVLKATLGEIGIEELEELQKREALCHKKLELVDSEIKQSRSKLESLQTHVTDLLREEARSIAEELTALEVSIDQVSTIQADDKRHLNEIIGLSVKVEKMHVAREILHNVSFIRCPCCNQSLPGHSTEENKCNLCGQNILIAGEEGASENDQNDSIVKVDIKNRIDELKEMIDRQNTQLQRMRNRYKYFFEKKQDVDKRLTQKMKQYDSQYLAATLEHEKNKAKISEELKYIQKIILIVKKSSDLEAEEIRLRAEEAPLRQELENLRTKAAKDATNLNRLSELFLECLLQSKVSGFEASDKVDISQPWFLPAIEGGDAGELVQTSFSTLGSGGKKNLFKCCFAIAFHRLATELSALLPTFLIIDSPMKNISERENREQFKSFHEMLYQLADTELKETQIIIIDKECHPPEGKHIFSFSDRLMTLDDPEHPPLISYYHGK